VTTGPGSKAGYPAGDVGAIVFVLGAEGFSQCRLLVQENKYARHEPGEDCVGKEVFVSEKQGLAENQCCQCDVHGISDIAVGAADDEVSRWMDGGRRSNALESEACEGFEDHSDTGGHEEDADGAKGCETQEGWLEAPVGDPPGDESRDSPGGEDEKSCCSQDGDDSPGLVLRLLLGRHWVSLVAGQAVVKDS